MNTKRIKCVLLGASGVGKSSLARRWIHGCFDEASEPTIGAVFLTKQMTVGNSAVQLELWDTAGQERYQSLTPLYYRGASVAIIVYDASQATNDVDVWRQRLHDTTPHAIVAVVANKCDLCQDLPPTKDDLVFHTSAKTNQNVDALFEAVVSRAVAAPSHPQPKTLNVHQTKRRKPRCTACQLR